MIETTWLVLWVLDVLAIALAIVHIILNKREPVAAVMWIFMVASLPGLGLVLYLVFGVNFHNRRVIRKVKSNFRVRQELAEQLWQKARRTLQARSEPYRNLERCHKLLENLRQRPPVEGNTISLLVGGAATYKEIFHAIDAAQSSIHIQVYILASDALGRDLLARLEKKARAGVEVRVLYDAVGSIGISRSFLRKMESAGIRVQAFGHLNPIRRGFQINFRNHRKNMIIDGVLGFTGGINLHAENSLRYSRQPGVRLTRVQIYERLIRDYHFRVEGPVVSQLQEVFVEDWHFMTGELLLEDRYFPPATVSGTAIARVLTSGPGDDAEVISRTIFAAITAAHSEILIVSPYFYPDQAILTALMIAARSSVSVHLIVPLHSDHVFVTWAGESLFAELVAAGVTIHLRRPPFIHSKAILVDRSWALVGSSNLDYRSLRLNFEMNLEVLDPTFLHELGAKLDFEMTQSAIVHRGELKKWSSLRRFRNNFCALFAPVL